MAVKFVQEIDVDGNVTSDGFVKNGGTSAGFLKADGSVDTNTYSTSAGTVGGSGADNRLPKFSTGGNDVENSTISDNGTDVTLSEGRILLNDTTFNQIKSSGNTQYVGTTNGVNTLKIGTSTTGWKSVTTEAGSSEWKTGGTQAMSLNHATGNLVVEGSVTADSIVKDGGTSSQFLKADGSVDSTTYATGTIPTNNNQLTNGASYYSNGDDISASGLEVSSDSFFYSDVSIEADLDMTESGKVINLNAPTSDKDAATKKYVDDSIPSATSDLTNDSGFLTSLSGAVLTSGTQTVAGAKTFSNTVKFSGTFGNLDTVNDRGMQFELGTSTTNTLRTDADNFRIYFGGTGGIGQAYKISQTGQHDWDGASGANKMRLTTGGDLHVDADVIGYSTTVSDASMKDNVKTIENAEETVKALRGVSYEWNKGSRKGKSEIGLIAQEVEQVLPDLVHEKEMMNGDLLKTVDYQKMIGLLIESNKELYARIEKLECGCSTCDCK